MKNEMLVGWAVVIEESNCVVKMFPSGKLKEANAWAKKNRRKYIAPLKTTGLFIEGGR